MTTICPDSYAALEELGEFTFRFVEESRDDWKDTVRIYVERMPRLPVTSAERDALHLVVSNGTAPLFIAIKRPHAPKDLNSARLVARAWSDLATTYLGTGTSIDEQLNPTAVPSEEVAHEAQ